VSFHPFDPPFILAIPPGPLREEVLGALAPAPGLRVEDDWSRALEAELEAESQGGVLVVDGTHAPEETGRLLHCLMQLPGYWSAVLVERDPEGRLKGVPLSPGFPVPLPELARGDGGAGGLRFVMRSLSRARHDINNPLTSALAEVQLLLLDGESDPGLAESMEIIQEQLRRIRDLVIGLSRFRPPSG
jgi:signal transduction histidine kinase